HPCSDQRAALLGCLDDYDSEAQSRQDAVASREILRQRLHSNRELAYQRTAGCDNRLGQLAMLGGINDVDAASQHRDGLAVRVEGTLMRLAVDSAREAAHDAEALGGELEAEPIRHPPPDIAGRASADDRDAVSVCELRRTAHEQEWRRVGDLAQIGRIVGVGPLDQPRADIRQLAQLFLERFEVAKARDILRSV